MSGAAGNKGLSDLDHIDRKDGLCAPARALQRTAYGFAMTGGFVFVILIVMSIISIVGRKLFNAPIQGDIELMQMGTAVGAAAFLPYCEIYDHHIKVDAFTGWVALPVRAALDALAHSALVMMAVLLTWRTGLQVMDAYGSGEVSTLLSVPVWIPVALLVPSFALLAFTALYRVRRAIGTAREDKL